MYQLCIILWIIIALCWIAWFIGYPIYRKRKQIKTNLHGYGLCIISVILSVVNIIMLLTQINN